MTSIVSGKIIGNISSNAVHKRPVNAIAFYRSEFMHLLFCLPPLIIFHVNHIGGISDERMDLHFWH